MSEIIQPHGNYQELESYQNSVVIFDATSDFCTNFLKKGDRTIDQMIQAARSGKQNIIEGCMASGISSETEIKLVGVARASLEELLEDYRDYLKKSNLQEWPIDCEKAVSARDYAKAHNDWLDWKEIFETRPAETLCNLMLTICNQASYMLGRMIERQEADFKKFGGVRERMHAARTAARGEDFDRSIYSRLVVAKSPEELEVKLAELQQKISRAAASIKRKKGW